MNDRFRFRFWDTDDKKYSDEWCVSSLGFNVPRIIPEQCTGIKDRNGKLIYEGDIVELDDGTEINNAVIEWEEQFGQWVICTTDTTYTGTIYTFDNLYGNDLTVIGNIHENIDLLRNNDE